MDNFFQKLRDIQKKERNTGTLSEIDDSFYRDASNYLQELLKMVNNNPLSLEAYQLRDAQRITTEICERREFKIVSTAATNVQKAHDIFNGHRQDSELYDIIPYNTTPEEEEFYRKIVDMMVSHRENLMDKIVISKEPKETKIGFKPTVKKETEAQKESEEKNQEAEEQPSETSVSKAPKAKPAMLDESQIAMMFGQAPDDVLLDENNNPVKTVRKSTAPVKGPEPPQEDTVALQNTSDKKTDKNNNQEAKEAAEESHEKDNTSPGEDEITETADVEEAVVENIEYNDFELVEFKQDIETDILDENEKTYGPFSVDDIVLLPCSLVEILMNNDVINVIN